MENKEKYTSDLYIIKHFLKLAHGISKTYIPTLFFSSLFAAAVPFLNIIMPKYIIDELLHAQPDEDDNQVLYHKKIIDTIIRIENAEEFIR